MNTPDTPTPRTDEAECENFPSTEPIVAAKRMRKLERELTAAKEELEIMRVASLDSGTFWAECLRDALRDKDTQLSARDAELALLRTESLEQARLLGMSGEREADLRGEIERLRRRVEAADGLAEAAEDALHHTINTPTYPDGPCMNKEYRDDLRTTLSAYRATEGKKL